jgi:hypothetical protein
MRFSIVDGLDREVVAQFTKSKKMNSFFEIFLRAVKFIRNQEILNVRMAIHETPRVDLRTHNYAECNEVAAILFDDNMGAKWEIILLKRGGASQPINETHLTLHFTVPTWRISLACSSSVSSWRHKPLQLWLFRSLPSAVRQMPGYNSQRRDTASTLPN